MVDNVKLQKSFLLYFKNILVLTSLLSLHPDGFSQKISIRNIFFESDILYDFLIEESADFPQHLTISLGYQFNSNFGLGISYNGYTQPGRSKLIRYNYPVFYFNAISSSIDYRIIRNRLFAKASLGHIHRINSHTHAPIRMKYYGNNFSPYYQLKVGFYIFRFISLGCLWLQSSNLNIEVTDYSNWQELKDTEKFQFRTFQVFIGVGIPEFKKN